MDWLVYRAISQGMDPVRAIQLATINPAQYLGLRNVGAIAPGYYANMITVSDLENIDTEEVFYRGYLVGIGKEPHYTPRVPRVNQPIDTIHMKEFKIEDLALKPTGEEMPVINIVPDQIITKKTMEKPLVENGFVVPDTKRDILKIAVVERHKGTGNIGLGLIKGFGLKKGAVASSVAHDSHNIIAVGTNDEDIEKAIKEIEIMQGGLVMVLNGEAIGKMELPLAGILSLEPAEAAAGQLHDIETLVKVMGVSLDSPFTALSFMALPVIPEIRITDKGMIDVEKFEVIS